MARIISGEPRSGKLLAKLLPLKSLQPRSISIYANDTDQYRERSGRLLALMHTTLCGTVYIHQGQEIGMINLPDDWPLEEWKDCKTQNVAEKCVPLVVGYRLT